MNKKDKASDYRRPCFIFKLPKHTKEKGLGKGLR